MPRMAPPSNTSPVFIKTSLLVNLIIMSERYAVLIHPLSEIENENLLILEEKRKGFPLKKNRQCGMLVSDI